MGEGFIVRRGGVGGEPIPVPTITFVSKTPNSITFTLTNNSIQERDITYGLTTPPTTTTITLESQATSANQTISGLDDDTEYTIYAQAQNGLIGELTVTTDLAPVYTAATGGTTEEYDENGKRYKSHRFNSSGTFTVTTAGNGDRNKVEYLVVAGGGAGGENITTSLNYGGGGGGAGGLIFTDEVVSVQSYSITVGLGGTRVSTGRGNSGNISTALSTTTAGGGGGGRGGSSTPQAVNQGLQGGSGGGAGSSDTGTNAGGPGISGQGFKGGNTFGSSQWGGTSGGGATSQGQDGIRLTINGSDFWSSTPGNGFNFRGFEYARGGQSRTDYTFQVPANQPYNINWINGPANSGHGGKGGFRDNNPNHSQGSRQSGNGGSGVVIIRYEIAPA